jgi:hypothetical protein
LASFFLACNLLDDLELDFLCLANRSCTVGNLVTALTCCQLFVQSVCGQGVKLIPQITLYRSSAGKCRRARSKAGQKECAGVHSVNGLAEAFH